MITQEKLKESLHYNQDTGVFTWNELRSGIKKSLIAGSMLLSGYVHIQIHGKFYLSHRLAWLYVYGE